MQLDFLIGEDVDSVVLAWFKLLFILHSVLASVDMEDQLLFIKHMIFVIGAGGLVAEIFEVHFSTDAAIIIISWYLIYWHTFAG